jgi:hypothetical protein
MNLLDFIYASRRVRSPEALFELFIETMSAIGYNLINFSVIGAHDIPDIHLGFGKINTYPAAWQQYYVRCWKTISEKLCRVSTETVALIGPSARAADAAFSSPFRAASGSYLIPGKYST